MTNMLNRIQMDKVSRLWDKFNYMGG